MVSIKIRGLHFQARCRSILIVLAVGFLCFTFSKLCHTAIHSYTNVPKIRVSDLVSSEDQSSLTHENKLAESIRLLNELGRVNQSSEALLKLLKEGQTEGTGGSIIQAVSHHAWKTEDLRKNSSLKKLNLPSPTTNIAIAILVCGDRREEALIMLKSAVMFSLDANLHVVIVSDVGTILDIGQDVLRMKLALHQIGYFGFTYELYLEWYPNEASGPEWKNMYRMCATQRLFFPTLLKQHDALIFLDIDVLILANLTELWEKFHTEMRDKKLVGVTPNSEVIGMDYPGRPPYYGPNGINAGVMLMNLTQMRKFNFEARAKGVYTAYDYKIQFADQDIINAILNGFPEKVLNLSCAHNFYWIHCVHPGYECLVQNGTKNRCFCNEALNTGVRAVHGNSGTFGTRIWDFPFIRDTYTAFQELNMLTDPYASMFKALREKFYQVNSYPCFPLTADALYRNAEKYLRNLQLD